jgi:hypothetical protein
MSGFIFYDSFYKGLHSLDGDDYKTAIEAICLYAFEGIEPDGLTPMQMMAFELIRPQIDANERRRQSGQRGGRPKAEVFDEKTNGTEEKTSGSENENHRLCDVETSGYENENHRLRDSETSGFESENHRLSDEKPKVKEKDKDKEKEKVKAKAKAKEKDGEASAELCSPPAAVEAIILNDGSDWRPSQEELEEYERLYPSVNVPEQFALMRGWCKGNPSRRKTASGVRRFVTSWLSKEQNNSRAAPKKTSGRSEAMDFFMRVANGEEVDVSW